MIYSNKLFTHFNLLMKIIKCEEKNQFDESKNQAAIRDNVHRKVKSCKPRFPRSQRRKVIKRDSRTYSPGFVHYFMESLFQHFVLGVLLLCAVSYSVE